MTECYISPGMLISKYNPYYYQRLFKEMEEEIEDMYHLSNSVVTDSDSGELIVRSFRVDDIAIKIVERKETMERLKVNALEHCSELQAALSSLPGKYQAALYNAQSNMNIRSMNKNQLDDICSALWAIVDQGEDKQPINQEHSQMTHTV